MNFVTSPIWAGAIANNNWSPLDIPNLKAFYDVSTLTGFSDGDDVETLTDLSGNGFNATQSTLAKRPLYRSGSGSPYLEFDGVNDGLGTGVTQTFNDFGIVCVFELRSSVAYQRIIDKTFNTGMWFGQSGAGQTVGGGVVEGSAPYGDFISFSLSTWYVGLIQREGTSKKVKLALTEDDSTVASTALSSDEIFIGMSTTEGNHCNVNIKEIIIKSDSFTAGELSSLDSYMTDKYGLRI